MKNGISCYHFIKSKWQGKKSNEVFEVKSFFFFSFDIKYFLLLTSLC